MPSPLVSIVMPAYNAEPWIAEALESALAQTYDNFEVVVVNDGSTDGTGAILQRYSTHPRIRLFQQANAGQAAAANAGLGHARGEYIKFFDADDVLSAEFVAEQVRALGGHPDCLAYGTWGRFYSATAEATFTPHPGWHDGQPVEWILETWADCEPMYQCALFLIPRTLLARTGGWNAQLGLINDFEFFTRLVLASGGIVFTPGARLFYRSGITQSLSRQKSAKAIASGVLSCQLAVQHLLAAEESPRSRQASANILQSFLFSFYPMYPELGAQLMADIRRLGGSALQPGGGLLFRLLARGFGWRFALKLRHRNRR